MSENLTPLGRLLEKARTEVLRISTREAARRARISDTRWRQVVTGVQRKAGADVPVNPTDRTVIAMANAVGVDPADALEAAGYARVDNEHLAIILRELEQPGSRPATEEAGLIADLERIRGLKGYAPKDKIRMAQLIVNLYEEAEAESE